MASRFIISVDFGGTKILAALLDSKNKIVSRVKIPTDAERGAEFLISSIADSVKKILKESGLNKGRIKAVCLGVPGTVNPSTGIIGLAPNLGIKNFNIKKALEKKISIPVLIENDVNLAGIGIMNFEMDKNVRNALIVFLGTGIGAALFFDGKLYRGSSFYAGEIGHMLVNSDGSLSSGKGKSTFESLASRTAIVREIRKELPKKKKSVMYPFRSPNKMLKSRILAEAIRNKDSLAIKHVSNAATITGTVLGSVATLLNVDTIILGGGVIEAMGGFMLPIIKSAFKEAVLREPGRFVNISITKLGDDAALFGGIGLAEELLG
jgi:glucokinase